MLPARVPIELSIYGNYKVKTESYCKKEYWCID